MTMGAVPLVPRVGVITVGDEILDGRVCDRHSAWISSYLEPHGYRVSFHLSVGDDEGALSAALAHPPAQVECIVITGGLGPTDDDRTRAEVAAAVGDRLEFREESWRTIEAYYRSFGREPSELNRRQALFPVSAREIVNPHGTAPAFEVVQPRTGQVLWVLPGVPHELHALFRSDVFPGIRSRWPVAERRLAAYRFFGISESELAGWLRAQLPPQRAGEYHICVSDGELEVRVCLEFEIEAAARAKYGCRFVGRGDAALPQRLVREATARAVSLATAESCTGGLVCERITAVPGASRVLAGGWVTYDNAWKHRELGVPLDTIESCGAVSAETACAMARGAARGGDVQYAVAVTGIAGPSGGSESKPVGTVYLGLAVGAATYWQRCRLRGDRERIRSLAANHALFGLLCAVREEVGSDWTQMVS